MSSSEAFDSRTAVQSKAFQELEALERSVEHVAVLAAMYARSSASKMMVSLNMHVLKFGGASASSDYSYLAGWYYAVGVQHGERSYFCYTNGHTMCRLPDSNWYLLRNDGG